MRIVQVINSLTTGGAEKLLVETILLYRDKGIQMDILVLDGRDYPFMKELKMKYKGEIFSLSTFSTPYNPYLIFKIIKFLRCYDIAHVHLFPALYWVALAKWFGSVKIKLIYTEHNTTNRRRRNPLFKLIDRLIYGMYDKIICISKDVEEEIKKYLNFSDNKFVLINNGLNIARILNASGYLKTDLGLNLDNSNYLIIQVSRFQEQKDQATVIRAISKMPNNVHLILVGDGKLKKQNEILAKQLNLSTRVHFLGVRMDVLELIKSVDMVVLSSHHEGLSLASIEGLASGKPFVASDVPGLKEIVSGAGILFAEGDDEALALIVRKLIKDKSYTNEVVNKCLSRAKEYDIELMIEKNIALYVSV